MKSNNGILWKKWYFNKSTSVNPIFNMPMHNMPRLLLSHVSEPFKMADYKSLACVADYDS